MLRRAFLAGSGAAATLLAAPSVRTAASAGAKTSREFVDRVDKSGIEELRRRGMTIIEDVDRPAFVAALAGIEGDFEKQFGKDQIDAIRAFGS